MSSFNAVLGAGVWQAGVFLAARSGYDCIRFVVNPNLNGMGEIQKQHQIIGNLCHCVFLCFTAVMCINFGAFVYGLSADMSIIPLLLDRMGKMNEDVLMSHIACCVVAVANATMAMLLK